MSIKALQSDDPHLKQAGVTAQYASAPSGSDLVELSRMIEQGQPKVIVDKVYPVAEIGEALAYVENGHVKGKVVVTIS